MRAGIILIGTCERARFSPGCLLTADYCVKTLDDGQQIIQYWKVQISWKIYRGTAGMVQGDANKISVESVWGVYTIKAARSILCCGSLLLGAFLTSFGLEQICTLEQSGN